MASTATNCFVLTDEYFYSIAFKSTEAILNVSYRPKELPVGVCWRRSLVKMSVFGRRIFPALGPIYGWQVTTFLVNCPLWVSQLNQLSLPSPSKWVVSHIFTWLRRWWPLKLQTRAVWLQAKVCNRGLGLQLELYAGSVCEDSAAETVYMRQLWRYKNESYLYLFIFLLSVQCVYMLVKI